MQTKVNDTLNRMDASLGKLEFMNALQAKTGLKKSYLAIGGGFLIAFFLLFGLGPQFVANLVGFGYPAYASFRAIETKSPDDDKQWLTYWVVFAFLTLLETFSGFLIYWFPPYFSLKLAFLVYLQLPQTQGALFVYTQFLAPMLKHNVVSNDAPRAAPGGYTTTTEGGVSKTL